MNQHGNHIITGDTLQTDLLLTQLFNDDVREVPLDKLKLPKTMPSFKLRDILSIADKIVAGEIDEQLTVNRDFMITNGLKRYYALKRLGRQRVRVCFDCNNNSVAEDLFSIRK